MSGQRRSSTRTAEFPALAAAGLTTFDITGDGNCLFRAFSDQLFGHPHHHSIVRDAIVHHVRTNKEYYMNFITVNDVRRSQRSTRSTRSAVDQTLPTKEEIDEKFEQRVQQMAKTGTWGDNIEIGAFAGAFHVQVKVWQRDFSVTFPEEDPAGPPSHRPQVHVAYHDYEHYSSVRKNDEPHVGILEPFLGANPMSTANSSTAPPPPKAETPPTLFKLSSFRDVSPATSHGSKRSAAELDPEQEQENNAAHQKRRRRTSQTSSQLSSFQSASHDSFIISLRKHKYNRERGSGFRSARPASPILTSIESGNPSSGSDWQSEDSSAAASREASVNTEATSLTPSDQEAPSVVPKKKPFRLVLRLNPPKDISIKSV